MPYEIVRVKANGEEAVFETLTKGEADLLITMAAAYTKHDSERYEVRSVESE